MSQSVREAFDRATEAFNAHDVDAFVECFSDDFVQTTPGGGRAQGRSGAREFATMWFGAFPDAHVDVQRLVIEDDSAAELGTFSGTHTGVLRSPDGDVPPTGRSVRASYMQILRYRDGLCVSADLIYDRMELLEQLGLVPQEAATA
jgi:steroid delta-isomerase-like uncharacterized protein